MQPIYTDDECHPNPRFFQGNAAGVTPLKGDPKSITSPLYRKSILNQNLIPLQVGTTCTSEKRLPLYPGIVELSDACCSWETGLEFGGEGY